MLKRILSFLMALVMVVGMLPASAYATEIDNGDENTVAETQAPETQATEAPAESTEAATEPTEAATESTEAATESTEAATEPTEAATESTEAATESTEAATESTEAATESTEAAAPVCECTVKCTSEAQNKECPYCNAEGADLIGCVGEEQTVEVIADETETTYMARIGDQGYATLAEAIAAAKDSETITLNDGTHTLSGAVENKNITITGSGKAVVEMLTAVRASDSTINFEGVTAKFDNENYEGLQHSAKVTYKNCTLIGTQFLYAPVVEFTGCTFEMYDAKTEYSVWTYGAKNVTFTNCTFNTNGKAILVYIEAATVADIKLNNCEFKSNGTFTDKAAVEVGQSAHGAKSTYTLTFDSKCTADGNFVANNSTSNLWGNKNSMDGEGLTVVIGGETVYPAAPVDPSEPVVPPVVNVGSGEVTQEEVEEIKDAVVEQIKTDSTSSAPVKVEVAQAAETTSDVTAVVDAVSQAIEAAKKESSASEAAPKVELTIPVKDAAVTFNAEAVNTIIDKAVTAEAAETKAVALEVKPAAASDETSEVSEYEITLTVGGETVSQLDGTAAVTLPAVAGAEKVRVYFINDAGEKQYLDGTYNVVGGKVTFETTHFSTWGTKAASETEEPSDTEVAELNGTKYTTLQAAIDDANNGQEILLLGNYAEKGTEVETGSGEFFVQILNKDITIDLGGCTFEGSFYLNSGAKLTIDNGNIVSFEGNASSCIESVGGSLVLGENLTAHSSVRHAIRVKGGSAVINGGTYKTTATGNITAHALNISHASVVTINNGIFMGSKGTSTATSGNAVMIQDNASTVKIHGGDFSNAIGVEGPVSVADGLTIYNGSFDVWYNGYDKFVTETKAVIYNEETARYILVDAMVQNTKTGKRYGTIQDAIDGATSGETITLLADITINAEDGKPETHAWVKEGQNVVIDLNDKTVTGAFFINGTATIKNGVIENKSLVSGIETQGTLTLEDVTVTSDRHGVRISGGTTTFLSGTYQTLGNAGTRHAVNASGSAHVIIEGGTFIGAAKANLGGSGNCLMLQNNASAEIKGGEFYGANGVEGPISANTGLVISGGKFADTAETWRYQRANMADGYVAVKLEGDANCNYEVIKLTNWAQVADTSWYDENANNFSLNTPEKLAGLAELVNAGNNFSGKTITLTADIDLSGESYGTQGVEWTPIGNAEEISFAGNFDGGSKTISNLTITGTNSYVGLFGRVANEAESNLSFANVTLTNVKVTGEKYVAGLIADAFCVNITNCHVNGDIYILNQRNDNYTGAIAGHAYANFSNCSAKDTGSDGMGHIQGCYSGGIAGWTGEANSFGGYMIENCQVENINFFEEAGTIVGLFNYGVILKDCSAKNCTIDANTDSGLGYTGLVAGDNRVNETAPNGILNVTLDNVTGTVKVSGVVQPLTQLIPANKNSVVGTGVELDANKKVTAGTFTAYHPSIENAVLAPGYVATENSDGTFTVMKAVAQIDETMFGSLQEAVNAAKVGSTITLVADIEITDGDADPIVIEKDLTLDFGEHTLFLNIPDATSATKNWFGIRVKNDANVTFKGTTGGIKTAANGELYAVVVGTTTEAGTLTIKGGSYIGGTSSVSVTKGTATIEGGSFEVQTNDTRYNLNCNDGNYKNSEANIIVNGGSFKDWNPSCNAAEGNHTNFAADGYIGQADEKGVYTLVAGSYAAQTETQCYVTLAEAVEKAEAGSTVQLIEDIELAEMLKIAQDDNLVLDLNGHAITVAKISETNSLYAFDNEGTLTLKDSQGNGSITARGVKNHGTMVMESGTIYTCDTNGGYGVWNYGTFTMNGGAIKTTHHVGNYTWNNSPTCLRNESDGKANLAGGTLESTNVAVYVVISVGTLEISGDVTVTGPRGVAVDAGNATINGGSFTTYDARYVGTGDNSYTAAEIYYPLYVHANDATVTINGGTFGVECDDPAASVNSVHIGTDEGSTITSKVTVKGGTFNAPLKSKAANHFDGIVIEGGKFLNWNPDCAEGSVHNSNTGWFEPVYHIHGFVAEGKIGVQDADGYYTLTDGAYAAQTETQCYATLAEAVEAAEAGSTVKLLGDASGDGIVIDKNITIDLGGYRK